MMVQTSQDHRLFRIKCFIEEDGVEIGRASVCIIFNDGSDRPYGLLEDVYVEEAYRGNGYGKKLVEAVIKEAKKHKCRKIRATCRNSRRNVHEIYKKWGFEKYGAAFVFDLD